MKLFCFIFHSSMYDEGWKWKKKRISLLCIKTDIQLCAAPWLYIQETLRYVLFQGWGERGRRGCRESPHPQNKRKTEDSKNVNWSSMRGWPITHHKLYHFNKILFHLLSNFFFDLKNTNQSSNNRLSLTKTDKGNGLFGFKHFKSQNYDQS